MPFNSLNYLIFIPVVYLTFYFAGERARWCILLAASFLFYAALKVPYLPVTLLVVATVTYGFGIWLDQAESRNKKGILWGGIAANTIALVSLKYLPFLSENFSSISALLHLDYQIQPIQPLVAIGVSYYIFQAMSYLFDIYLEIEKPERHFGYFALYLSFFPKLLQGPIERASDLIPQLKTKYEFNYDNIRFGMLLFTWGLFKKVVIADRLGLYVDHVYSNVHAFAGLPLLLATYTYAFQIYMDFSGYTDMALGSARLFNIDLTQNFNSPYLATSVADFWRRWHITFSRWILDYIFKPLQMQWRNLKSWGTAIALVAAFLISGIWHGARWGFVLWGGLHGLYMACSVFYRPYQKKLHKALKVEKNKLLKAWQMFVTFNLVSFAWVFFRADNLKDAVYVAENMFVGTRGVKEFIFSMGSFELLVTILTSVVVISISLSLTKMKETFRNVVPFRWSLYYILLFTILAIGKFGESSFIYFKF